MDKIIKIGCLSLITIFVLAGCTKKNVSNDPIPDNAILNNSGDRERLIVNTTVVLPENLRKAAKPLDILIWDVKDNRGLVVALGMVGVEKFPVQLKVKARDLMRPLDPKSPIAVYVRLVRVGDEAQPPKKGQLTGFMGLASSAVSEPVVPEKISKKILEGVEKKLGLSEKFKALAIGESTKITLEPYRF